MNPLHETIPLKVQWVYIARGMIGWNHRNLSAPFWRFYWNSSAGHSMSFERRVYQMTPATAYLIPAYTPFSAFCSGPVDHFHIHFSVGTPYDTTKPGIYPVEVDAGFERLIMDLSKLIGSSTKNEQRISLLAHSIIFFAMGTNSALLETVPANEGRLYPILQYMYENSSNRISNSELAGKMNMNVNTFMRYFKKRMGVAPHEYLNRKRIDNSCTHLLYTERSIEEIAELCGFCDRFHFSRVFRKYKETGPAEYRKKATAL